MSRTIRRQNAHQRNSYVGRLEDVDQFDIERYGASSPKDCLAKKQAWFHGDFRSGVFGVPYWYCRQFNRRIHRENVQEIHRCLKLGDWSDHLPISWRGGAGYSWW